MSDAKGDEIWERYARAVIGAMAEVLEEADDKHREVLLETADFWLDLGLLIGLERPAHAKQLLSVIERQADERTERLSDADDFLATALR